MSINDCYNFVPDDELYTYFMNMYNPNLAYTTQVVNAVAFMNAEVPQFAKWNNYRAVMKSIVENHSELYKKIDHSIPDSLEATTGVVSDSTKSQTILNPTALAYVCMKKAKDEKKNKRKRQTKRQQPSTPKEKKPVEPKPESEPYYGRVRKESERERERVCIGRLN